MLGQPTLSVALLKKLENELKWSVNFESRDTKVNKLPLRISGTKNSTIQAQEESSLALCDDIYETSY